MIKRTVILVGLLLALSVQAASADSGNPPSSPKAKGDPAANAARVNERIDKLRDRIQKVTEQFVKHCTDGKDAARCRAAAQRTLERLQKASGKIDDKVAKIEERCSGTSAPRACGRADEVIRKLQDLRATIATLSAKLQAWLDQAPSASSGDSSSSASGLESLADLAKDLAAAQAAAGS